MWCTDATMVWRSRSTWIVRHSPSSVQLPSSAGCDADFQALDTGHVQGIARLIRCCFDADVVPDFSFEQVWIVNFVQAFRSVIDEYRRLAFTDTPFCADWIRSGVNTVVRTTRGADLVGNPSGK